MISKFVLLLLAMVPLCAADVTGTWKAWFVGPWEERPKMVSEMTFDLKIEGDKVTGMAHMADWPGNAPITEGKVNGKVITFTVIGTSSWRAGSTRQTSGYPHLEFTWKLEGTEAQATLNRGSVMIYDTGAPDDVKGTVRRGEKPLEMAASKQQAEQ